MNSNNSNVINIFVNPESSNVEVYNRLSGNYEIPLTGYIEGKLAQTGLYHHDFQQFVIDEMVDDYMKSHSALSSDIIKSKIKNNVDPAIFYCLEAYDSRAYFSDSSSHKASEYLEIMLTDIPKNISESDSSYKSRCNSQRKAMLENAGININYNTSIINSFIRQGFSGISNVLRMLTQTKHVRNISLAEAEKFVDDNEDFSLQFEVDNDDLSKETESEILVKDNKVSSESMSSQKGKNNKKKLSKRRIKHNQRYLAKKQKNKAKAERKARNEVRKQASVTRNNTSNPIQNDIEQSVSAPNAPSRFTAEKGTLDNMREKSHNASFMKKISKRLLSIGTIAIAGLALTASIKQHNNTFSQSINSYSESSSSYSQSEDSSTSEHTYDFDSNYSYNYNDDESSDASASSAQTDRDLLLENVLKSVGTSSLFFANDGLTVYETPNGTGNVGNYKSIDKELKIDRIDVMKDGKFIQYKSDVTFADLQEDGCEILAAHVVSADGKNVYGWVTDWDKLVVASAEHEISSQNVQTQFNVIDLER